MGDLVCVRIIFPKPLVIEFFLLTYNGVFFYSFIRHEKGENFFSQGSFSQDFSPLEIGLHDIFSEIPHTTPRKSNGWPLISSHLFLNPVQLLLLFGTDCCFQRITPDSSSRH